MVCLSQKAFKSLRLGISAAILMLCVETPLTTSVVLAADSNPKPNPLELKKSDPLLRQDWKKQPLSQEERQQLKTALDELNAQAAAEYQAGNKIVAFEIWNRELRLRRVLGALEEVQALGRVGGLAWQDNQKDEIKVILERLQAIEQEDAKLRTKSAQKQINLPLLEALGQAYQQTRSPILAVNAYQQILASARQEQNRVKEEATLKTIAQLYMSRFDYEQAAIIYEELVKFAQAKGDTVNQATYIQQLAYVYEQAKKPENSVLMKQRLAENYVNSKDLSKLPQLKISIGTDYEALGKSEDASKNYQEAYSLAISLQQFAYASDALAKLGALYKSYDQIDYALEVYKVRLQVDQQSYDYYGLMNSYDQIGQIYVQQQKYTDAIAAFQAALKLAQSLKYQEDYFATQLERVNQQAP